MALTVVQSFANAIQAHIAKGLLESHGIKAVILHEGFHSTSSFIFSPVPLYVEQQDLEKASGLLELDYSATQDEFTA